MDSYWLRIIKYQLDNENELNQDSSIKVEKHDSDQIINLNHPQIQEKEEYLLEDRSIRSDPASSIIPISFQRISGKLMIAMDKIWGFKLLLDFNPTMTFKVFVPISQVEFNGHILYHMHTCSQDVHCIQTFIKHINDIFPSPWKMIVSWVNNEIHVIASGQKSLGIRIRAWYSIIAAHGILQTRCIVLQLKLHHPRLEQWR